MYKMFVFYIVILTCENIYTAMPGEYLLFTTNYSCGTSAPAIGWKR